MNQKEETKITQSTWVPVGAVMSVLVLVSGAIFWLSTLHSDVQYLKKQFSALEMTNERLARIETMLSEISKQLVKNTNY
jgi:hypothetical protein